jgi:hypothetical protein
MSMRKNIVSITLALLVAAMPMWTFGIQTVRAEWRTVGVPVGAWAKYSVSWTGPPDPYLAIWSETEWAAIDVTDVSGTVITFTATCHFWNNTEHVIPDVHWDIAPWGSFGIFLFFIGSNLQAGDLIYPISTMTINETVTRTYAGLPRANHHLDVSRSQPDGSYSLECYWDQATGILTEQILAITETDPPRSLSIHLEMIDTNLWEPLAPTTIDDLKAAIAELGSQGAIDNPGIVRSLAAKLNVAQRLVDKGKIEEAQSILEDDFIPQVQNLAGIHITVAAADILIESADYISSHL